MLGAVHEISALPEYATAVGAVGWLGTASVVAVACGVTDDDAVEAAEFPTRLVATTENETAVPLASPVTAHEVAPVVVQVDPFVPVTV